MSSSVWSSLPHAHDNIHLCLPNEYHYVRRECMFTHIYKASFAKIRHESEPAHCSQRPLPLLMYVPHDNVDCKHEIELRVHRYEVHALLGNMGSYGISLLYCICRWFPEMRSRRPLLYHTEPLYQLHLFETRFKTILNCVTNFRLLPFVFALIGDWLAISSRMSC